MPPHPPTQDAYFQQQIDLHVLAVMGRRYVVEANAALLASLSTVPEEQRDDVVMQIEHIIGLNGGYVVEKGTRSAKPPMAPFLPMPVASRDDGVSCAGCSGSWMTSG